MFSMESYSLYYPDFYWDTVSSWSSLIKINFLNYYLMIPERFAELIFSFGKIFCNFLNHARTNFCFTFFFKKIFRSDDFLGSINIEGKVACIEK